MEKLKITVKASAGLHARPAHMFCEAANKYQSDLQVRNVTSDSEFVNAKSILSVLTLGVSQGNEIEVTADGEDEEQAIQHIHDLIQDNFPADEGE